MGRASSGDENPGEGDHLAFEQLAVQHVLGGLSTTESSAFRDHLIGCEDCRRRVAELRGIAADLQVAAREERAVVQTKPEVERPDGDETDRSERPAVGTGVTVGRAVLIVVLAVGLSVLAFWNIHLRQVRATLEQSLEARGEALDILVEGDEVPLLTIEDGLDVQVVATWSDVAVNANGIRPIRVVENVVLWGRNADGGHRVLAFVGIDGIQNGRVVMTGNVRQITSITLTIEEFPHGNAPAGEVLLTADLP